MFLDELDPLLHLASLESAVSEPLQEGYRDRADLGIILDNQYRFRTRFLFAAAGRRYGRFGPITGISRQKQRDRRAPPHLAVNRALSARLLRETEEQSAAEPCALAD